MGNCTFGWSAASWLEKWRRGKKSGDNSCWWQSVIRILPHQFIFLSFSSVGDPQKPTGCQESIPMLHSNELWVWWRHVSTFMRSYSNDICSEKYGVFGVSRIAITNQQNPVAKSRPEFRSSKKPPGSWIPEKISLRKLQRSLVQRWGTVAVQQRVDWSMVITTSTAPRKPKRWSVITSTLRPSLVCFKYSWSAELWVTKDSLRSSWNTQNRRRRWHAREGR